MHHRDFATVSVRLWPLRRFRQTCKISPIATAAPNLNGSLNPVAFAAKINHIPPHSRLPKLHPAVADPGSQFGTSVAPQPAVAAIFRARAAWLKESRAGIFEMVEREVDIVARRRLRRIIGLVRNHSAAHQVRRV